MTTETKKVNKQTKTLIRCFLRDYYGKYFRKLDIRPHHMDKNVYQVIGLGYGQRMFVKDNKVYWWSLGNKVISKIKAEKLGYNLELSELFGLEYYIIKGRQIK